MPMAVRRARALPRRLLIRKAMLEGLEARGPVLVPSRELEAPPG